MEIKDLYFLLFFQYLVHDGPLIIHFNHDDILEVYLLPMVRVIVHVHGFELELPFQLICELPWSLDFLGHLNKPVVIWVIILNSMGNTIFLCITQGFASQGV